MTTLYDELQEKHQALLRDVQREIPPLQGNVQREISPELRNHFLERVSSLSERPK